MRASEFLNIDCMDKDKGMPSYPDKYFDLAIVDPPYGLGGAVVNSKGRFARYENKSGNWDMLPPGDEYFEELFRVSKNQIIWGGNYFNLPPSKCFLIWDKRQPEGVTFASSELAWTSFDKVVKTFYMLPNQQKGRFHPTQKPVALYKWLLTKYAKPNDKILDTHVGSASSLIACEDLGFDYVGYELDTGYYKSACKRIEQFRSQLKLSL